MKNLEQFIQERFEPSPMPGFACAAVVDDCIVWSKGFGWADVEDSIPMTADTVMNIASVAKTVTATVVCMLWEETDFDLDADINSFLHFSVRNPNHPDVPITVRQLLTHRSSIKDSKAYDGSYVCGTKHPSLEDWMHSYLIPGSALYSSDDNFHTWAPGTMSPPETPRCYSNIGYGLLAMVFEAIAGVAFESYCQMKLFDPLGMTHSTWRLNDVPPESHAGLYSLIAEDPKAFGNVEFVTEQLAKAQTAEPRSLFKHCLYSLPIATDGLLRTSVNELGRFLSLYTHDGVYDSERILKTETLQMILSNTHFGRALCWQGGPREGRNVRWHHGGGDPGVSTLIIFEPAHKLGVLLFSNFAGPAPFLSEVYKEIRSTFI